MSASVHDRVLLATIAAGLIRDETLHALEHALDLRETNARTARGRGFRSDAGFPRIWG